MNLVIFGPPGAGKGTQSGYIAKKFKLFQLSTGELLRNEIKNNTNLGKQISSIMNSGNLVSNELVSNLIEKYLSDKTYQNKIIFDGYPRTLIQAQTLNDSMIKYNQKIHIALRLTVSLDTIIKRIKERSALEKRDDDSEEIAIKRYETYEKNIKPVIDFYKQSNLLKDVNGESSIIEINNEISALIESIKGWL